ncbi:LysR family transcriptional regulator [Maritimibacter sp. 55A14]|uniref:LysR family transcriptional regulator n=1 Tax=Maritimibacter sp. 55A14 TaxID=2174844 RepID=UPI000D61763D|nr:LysR family transcriptional regulator [Maritimibacter sp. 55A14]PWE32231.1 LysR family transcriptional regulator [Maritimibacter sp. 55A14]
MENWDEIRTAYHVARLGTVSAAAGVLGVHHSTVIRHVDALEDRLGVKLFQRHQRGYTPTEAGEDLLQVAAATDDQFGQLAGRLRGRGASVSGELVVTTLAEMVGLLTPVLARFQVMHPDVTVRIIAGEQLLKLEYGEAHVAIRAGGAPQEPDNVVQRLADMPAAAYAHRDYLRSHGGPVTDGALDRHRFIAVADPASRAPTSIWMREHLPEERVTFRAPNQLGILEAVRAGAGIGFLPVWRGRSDPDLMEVMPPRPEWVSPLWQVTHVDLHRTAKVQAFTKLLRAAAEDWPAA